MSGRTTAEIAADLRALAHDGCAHILLPAADRLAELHADVQTLTANLQLVSEALLNPKELTIDADGVLQATPIMRGGALMDAIYPDVDGRHACRIVGVLYGARVMVRFEGSGEVIVPITMLELDERVAADLKQWRMVGPGALTEDEFVVLERLTRAGGAGLLDSDSRAYGMDRKRVEKARIALKHRGLVGPADARPAAEGEGRQVRWHLTKQGVVEYVTARTRVRPIAKGGGRQLANAVG